MAYRIKNWERFQHYKNRRPPWIKLYRELLDDPQYFALPDKSAKYLPLIWLIASDANGSLPAIKALAFRLRMTEKEINLLLSTLSHWVEQDASNVLATCKQSATPEQEGEGEKEREKEESMRPEKKAAPTPNGQKPLTELQKVVLVYKQVSGYAKDDPSWDKLNFARCAKSAKELIDFFGNWKDAADAVQDIYERLSAKGLTVTIETIKKHAADWKKDKCERRENRGVLPLPGNGSLPVITGAIRKITGV